MDAPVSEHATEPPEPLDAEALATLIGHGAAAHPDVAELAGMRAFVAARADAALAAGDVASRAADLYLAAACVAGDPAAIARLSAMLPALVRPALARLGLPPGDDDEIVQRVRVALVVPGAAAGIAGYSGRGDLRSYIRAVAVRLALKRLEREDGPPAGDDSAVLELLPAAADSPELRVLKERCRADVRIAFGAALATLSARERTLLRQHYVDGLTIDRLAPLHGVHRATCARWIEAARGSVLHAVRGYLKDTLGLAAFELDSMIELVRSQLDLSLARQLRSGDLRT
jgi:RNA polymerase sigma-70 factor (ECF subfamily)